MKCWRCEGVPELAIYRRAKEQHKYPTCTGCVTRLVDFLMNTGSGQILVERVKDAG